MPDATSRGATHAIGAALIAAIAAGDTQLVQSMLAPSVNVTPGGAVPAHAAAALLVERGARQELLTAIAAADRLAHLVRSTDHDEWFEGLNVFTVVDGRVIGVMHLASAANGAPESATPPSPPRPPAPTDDAGHAANIALVRRFYADTFGNGNAAALDELVTEHYLQHNPWVGPGRAGLARLIAMTGAAPMDGLGAGGVFCEGDHVVHISKLPLGDGFFLVDLFRVDGTMLAEHWDFTPLGMPLPMPPGADLPG
jgi:predicted SnoaL-like aldol condensation-catalyzing enzyme